MKLTTRIFAVLISSALFAGVANAADLGGTWTKKNYRIKGEWSIVHTEEGSFLELSDDFRTRNAPDLKLFLSPLPAADLANRNAVSGSLLISPLESNKGAQRYKLPEGTRIDDYQSLVLHCEQFSKLWGVSALASAK